MYNGNEVSQQIQYLLIELAKLKRQIADGGAIVKQYYTIQELSVITGISVLGLKGRRKRGQIRMINEGNEILIPVTEVNRYLKKLGTNLAFKFLHLTCKYVVTKCNVFIKHTIYLMTANGLYNFRRYALT